VCEPTERSEFLKALFVRAETLVKERKVPACATFFKCAFESLGPSEESSGLRPADATTESIGSIGRVAEPRRRSLIVAPRRCRKSNPIHKPRARSVDCTAIGSTDSKVGKVSRVNEQPKECPARFVTELLLPRGRASCSNRHFIAHGE
jgi:hypothetical protein